MKTLVIHPTDKTTDFLSIIYQDTNWTVLRDVKVSKSELKRQIKSHDKIIMLGHGSGDGLFAKNRMMIDSTYVYLLKEKFCVGIWCNANNFFTKYKLNGIYTGMIISEPSEAELFNLHEATDKQINESNTLFADSLKQTIDLETNSFLEKMMELYVDVNGNDNPIISFNRSRIHTTQAIDKREPKYTFSHNFEHVDENLNIIFPDEYQKSREQFDEMLSDNAALSMLNYYIENPNIEINDEKFEFIMLHAKKHNLLNKTIRLQNIHLRHKNQRKVLSGLDLSLSDCNEKWAIEKVKAAYYNENIIVTDDECIFDLEKRKNELLLLEILNS